MVFAIKETPSRPPAGIAPRFSRRAPLAALLAALIICVAVSGCATVPYTGRSQLVFMNESEELSLGAQASKQVLEKEREEKGTARAARVERVGKRIAAVAERPQFQWEFHTIPSETLNAFCLPGGKVFVYTALLDLTQGNDNELAAVMGHEIAHAVARHGAERVSQNQIAAIGQVAAQIGVAAATGSAEAADSVGQGYGLLTQLGILLPYSRKHETEADTIGIILAAKAGYDPRAAIAFWKKMGVASQGKQPPALLSTHPLNEQRIKDLEEAMPRALEYYKPK